MFNFTKAGVLLALFVVLLRAAKLTKTFFGWEFEVAARTYGSVSRTAWGIFYFSAIVTAPAAALILFRKLEKISRSLREVVQSTRWDPWDESESSAKNKWLQWVPPFPTTIVIVLNTLGLGLHMFWSENITKGERNGDDFHDRIPVRVFTSIFNVVGNSVLLFPLWARSITQRLASRGFHSWPKDIQGAVVAATEGVEKLTELERIRLRRSVFKKNVKVLLDEISPSVLVLIASTSLQLCVMTYLAIQDTKQALEKRSEVFYGTFFGLPTAVVAYAAYAPCVVSLLYSIADASYRIEKTESESLRPLRKLDTSQLPTAACAEFRQVFADDEDSRLSYRPGGFITLGREVLVPLFNAMATYLVVLVQMNSSSNAGYSGLY